MTLLLFLTAGIFGLAGLTRPAGYMFAPTLMSLVVAAWFAPQLNVVANDPFAPTSAIFDIGATGVLCVLAGWVGWAFGTRIRQAPPPAPAWEVDDVIIPLIMLMVFTVSMNVLLEMLRPDINEMSQWSGPITIVNFFAQLRLVPLVVSLLLVLHKPNPITIGLALLNLGMNIPAALIFLRRSEMIDIGLAIAGAFWFAKGRRLPFPAVISAMLVFGMVVYTIGPLRGAQVKIQEETGRTVSLISPEIWENVDITSSVQASVDQAPDVKNAVYSAHVTNEVTGLAWGGTLWNRIVAQYVPAQIVGADVKRDLMTERGHLSTDIMANQFDHRYKTGTTSTGIGTAYRDFGYFGFIYLLIIALILGKLYKHAICQNIWAQTAYLSLLPFALTSITHGHGLFFVNVPLYFAAVFGLQFLTLRNRRHRLQKRNQSLALQSGL